MPGIDNLGMETDAPLLTERFEDALTFAAQTHRTQVRKGSNLPYIGHLLGVASLVLEEGGDEDQAIAALLHDAVEDQGGPPMLETIRQRFGDRVGDIVNACTDGVPDPLTGKKPEWAERKRQYIAHLATAPADVLLVSLADKLFNARAIVQDYLRVGPQVWTRFSQGSDAQLGYYRGLADAFLGRGDDVPRLMAQELDRVVKQMEALHAASATAIT